MKDSDEIIYRRQCCGYFLPKNDRICANCGNVKYNKSKKRASFYCRLHKFLVNSMAFCLNWTKTPFSTDDKATQTELFKA